MLKVYGASDDLIELDGDLYEEFNRFDSDGEYLGFSDGTVLKIHYDENGIWRINLIFKGSLFKHIEQGSVESDTNDVALFDDGVKWCVIGKEIAK